MVQSFKSNAGDFGEMIIFSPFLSAIESKKHQGASGPKPHLTKET